MGVLFAVPTPVSGLVSIGSVIAAAVFPVLLSNWLRSRNGRLVSGIVVALVISGICLSLISQSRLVSTELAWEQVRSLGNTVLTAAGYLWILRILGPRHAILLWALGTLASTVFFSSALFVDDPWKYGLAAPVTVILGSFFFANSWLLRLLFAASIVALSIGGAYRSWIVLFFIGATVALIALRASASPSKRSKVMLLGLPLIAYLFGVAGTRLAVAGALGDYAQRRTLEQLAAADNNLLLGGRPEWAAAVANFWQHPTGFGIGAVPTQTDYLMAIRAMPLASKELQDTSTVATYFASGKFSYHSIIWDYWAIYGLLGWIVIASLCLFSVWCLARLLTLQFDRKAYFPMSLLLTASIWDLLFSPDGLTTVGVALALCLWIHEQSSSNSSGVHLSVA
jgi:hypothetical protein